MHTWELHHLLQDKFALGWENGQRTDFAEKSRTILYFLQQIFTTRNSLNCCMTGLNVANKIGNITIQLQLWIQLFSWPCRLKFSLKKKKVGNGVWTLRASSPKSATVLWKQVMPVSAFWWLFSLGPHSKFILELTIRKGDGNKQCRIWASSGKSFCLQMSFKNCPCV